MTRYGHFVVLLLLLVINSFTIQIIAQPGSSAWETVFKSPPDQYRPVPFWHLNGKLTAAEISNQMEAAHKSGFGGVTILPVTAGPQHPTGIQCPGMEPEFLSDGFFARYDDMLKNASRLGMQVIMYDDVDFPSGSAGNKMKDLYPGDTRKILSKTDTLITGPVQVKLTVPAGKLMSAVAIKSGSGDCQNLLSHAENGMLTWDVPQGNWEVMLFTCAVNRDNKVDFMDPSAIAKYMPLTYETYARRFGKYFGKTVNQVFYDDVGYVAMERGWTGAMNEKFRKISGRDPYVYYPALWGDIGTETAAARVAFFDARAELLAEGYPKSVAGWADQNKLMSSGHPPGNYDIQPVDMNFDAFKFYRHSHIPTLDYIFYHGHGRDGFKLISSAADVYDRPVVAAEVYGAFFEEQFDSLMLYRAAMEVFARGVNFIIPHGMWYDYTPESVRIPPLISAYSAKTGPALPAYNTFVARSCYMLQGGRRVSDIAVLYPIASLQAAFSFETGKPWGSNVAPGTDYLAIGNMLTDQAHRDFTFIHPDTWSGEQCKLSGEEIELKNKVNSQNFRLLIIPGGKVISVKALRKIRDYYENGGKVIATSVLPSQSAEFGKDAEVISVINDIFGVDPATPLAVSSPVRTNTRGGQAVFLPNPGAGKLSAMMEYMGISADVLFEHNPDLESGNGRVNYIHKVKENRNIYYVSNTTDDGINTFIELRGKINPELWYPENGSTSRVKDVSYTFHNEIEYTRFRLELPSVKSVFIVEKGK